MKQIAIAEGRHEVIICEDGAPIKEVFLAPKEFDILLLLTKSGQTMSRDQITKALWPKRKNPKDTRAIDQHISRARRKLRPVDVITTVPARGYKITRTVTTGV